MDPPTLPHLYRLDIQEYIEFMRTACRRFPFGAAWFARVVGNYDRLYNLACTPAGELPPSYTLSCYYTFKDFEAWDALSYLEWIRDHSRIHRQLMQRIGRHRSSYKMTDNEYPVWTAEVFKFIKAYTWANREYLREPDSHKDAQICIDAIIDIVESNKPNSRKQLNFLIKMCQTFGQVPNRLLYEFPLDRSHGGDDINISTSSEVRKVILDSGEAVAIKDIRLRRITLMKDKRQFIRKALILHYLYHPNILVFRGVICEPYRVCIVSDWLENGDINQFIRNHPKASIKELLEGVADGLDFMHSNAIVHGDLKGANILVDADGRPRISDFGLSSVYEDRATPRDPAAVSNPPLSPKRLTRAFTSAGLSESQSSTLAGTILSTDLSQAGTIKWMSPEQLDPDEYKQTRAKATPASDVFSFAMVAVEAYMGQTPFGSGVHREGYLAKILVEKERPSRPPNMPLEIWRIVEDCWRDSPQDRPPIKAVYFRISLLPR